MYFNAPKTELTEEGLKLLREVEDTLYKLSYKISESELPIIVDLRVVKDIKLPNLRKTFSDKFYAYLLGQKRQIRSISAPRERGYEKHKYTELEYDFVENEIYSHEL